MPVKIVYFRALEFNDFTEIYVKYMKMALQNLILKVRERKKTLWNSEGNYSKMFIFLCSGIIIRSFWKNIPYKGNDLGYNMDMFPAKWACFYLQGDGNEIWKQKKFYFC